MNTVTPSPRRPVPTSPPTPRHEDEPPARKTPFTLHLHHLHHLDHPLEETTTHAAPDPSSLNGWTYRGLRAASPDLTSERPPAGLAPGAFDVRLQHGAGVALPESPRLVAEGANVP